MARSSRIKHPPGSVFVQLHRWLIDVVGDAGAAVIGTLDFWDRSREAEGEWLGRNRDDIVYHLSGIVGRDRVFKALDDLIDRGWVEKRESRVMLEKNFTTRHELRLVAAKINAFLTSWNQEAGSPEIRRPGLLSSGLQVQEPTLLIEGLKEVNHHQRKSQGVGGTPHVWSEAAALEIENEGKQRPIRNLPGLRRAILARYADEGGPSAETMEMLRVRLEAMRRAAEREAAREATDAAAAQERHPGPPPSSDLGKKWQRVRAKAIAKEVGRS